MKLKRPAPMPKPAVRKQPPKLKINASVARSRASRVQHDDDDDYYDAPEPNMKLSHAFVVVLVLHVIAVGGVFAFNTIKANQRPAVIAAAQAEAVAEAEVVAAQAAETPATSGMIAPPSPVAVPPATTGAPVAQQSAGSPAASAASGLTHEVQAGETLTRIAGKHGVSVGALQEANEIEDPTKIRIGTLLVIPGKTATAVPGQPVVAAAATQSIAPAPAAPAAAPKPATPATPAASTSSVKDSGEIYEVVKGDNPVSIARQLNVSYNDLLALNGIDDPRRLQIGQRLKVPASN